MNENNMKQANLFKNLKKYIVIGVLALVAIIVILNSITFITSGTVGIIATMGTVNEVPLYEGPHFRAPFITRVTTMDIKTNKSDASCNAASRDLQTINMIVSVNYSVDKTSAPRLYKTVGLSYSGMIIVPAIQEAVKATAAQYSAEELITRRQEVSGNIKQKLYEKINSYGINVEQLNIINLDFSEQFDNAIEAKQIAEQTALKAEQDLVRIKTEAAQTVVKAQAEADATKAKADAEAYSIRMVQEQLLKNPDYIKYVEVSRWDGHRAQVEGGAMPIIDLR